ncbi:MAG: hypothetical protein CVV42_18340 [Candidatus Riflebacteria bacterium HGW-Riflebacteria-2]|jgi:PmbA protein|nr:MAG: hypothetical protein CVV42_18340 [Candidatus Riflebacteria bacterium HGW-Riflebacteria-2]
MKLKAFKKAVFDYAARIGLKKFELFAKENYKFEVCVSRKQMEKFSDAFASGCSFKALKEGKSGSSYTEVFDEESAKSLVDDAVENLSLIDTSDPDLIFEECPEYLKIPQYDRTFEKISVEEKIEWVLSMERSAMESDSRIIIVPASFLNHKRSETFISNSAGLEASFTQGGGMIGLVAVASDGTNRKQHNEYVIGSSPEKMDPVKIGITAARKALEYLGATSIPDGKYPVIFAGNVLSDLLWLFFSMLSAEQVQNGYSLLAGKLGQKVLSEKITLVERPNYPESMFNTPFDSQGVPTREKLIVEKGMLKTFLHNMKTARRDGVPPTGNFFHEEYRDKASIRLTNAVVQPGDLSLEQMLEKMGSGIMITDIQGMFSGGNPISGNFSFGAEGFLVSGGKKDHPVEQIAISANLLEMLSHVRGLGKQLHISYPFFFGRWAPDIWIDSIDISGSSNA